MIRKTITIALVSASLVSVPAEAQPNPRTEIVGYGDLDLSSPQGIATLDRRLHQAVQNVCGRYFPRDLQSMGDVRQCRRDSWASAQLQRNQAIATVTVTQIAVRSR